MPTIEIIQLAAILLTTVAMGCSSAARVLS